MSDYFRFYCDSMDEPRFQYAIHRQAAVLPAWVWTLCECTRMHTDTISKPNNAALLGLSHKLAATIGTINEAFNLLVEIEYIEEKDGRYKVRKWNDLQSQYLQRRVRTGKANSRKCTNSVRTVNQIDAPEERRGEESKGKKKEKKVAIAPIWTCPESLMTDRFKDAFNRFIEHRRQKGGKLTALAITGQLSRLESWGEARAIAAIDHSIAQNWAGIFEEKEGGNGTGERKREPWEGAI